MPMLTMRPGRYCSRPSLDPATPLGMHVAHVIEGCSQEQMVGIATGTNVAPVQHKHAFRHGTVAVFPHQTVD